VINQNEVAVTVANISKTFKIPIDKASGIKQVVVQIAKHNKGYRNFKVLDDISFEIKKGEFFGVVGRNGSGKSTLLKLLAGIYVPDSGAVHLNGSLTPFIELGVGFNPELSARENVFLNGALLGFSKQEVAGMYDEIVEFAELGDFMAEKLRNFSSGMQVRLAFSIAIKSNSDILLFDEVLAVGDTDFQIKCFDYFKKIKEDKSKTVILVTHDMSAVQKFCTRALVLQDGNIMFIGDPNEAAIDYQTINFPTKSEDSKSPSQKVQLTLADGKKNKKHIYEYGEKLTIDVVWDKSLVGVKNVGVAIVSKDGSYIFGTNTIIDKTHLKAGQQKLRYSVNLNIGGGTYTAKAAVFGETDDDTIFFNNIGLTFHVKGKNTWGGVTYLEHEWREE
jgi:ABC-2 type transport system ATP-binding protein